MVGNIGYDTGVISGALVSIDTDLDHKTLSTMEKVNIFTLFVPQYIYSPATTLGIDHLCDDTGCTDWRTYICRFFRLYRTQAYSRFR